MLNQSFEEYKSKTGVTVIMDSVPSTDAFIKLSTSIRAGQPYDIGNLLFIGDILLLAESGNLVPMTPLIDEIGRKDFGPKVLFPSKGEIWDYPYDYNFATLYYRTDWLERTRSVFRTPGTRSLKLPVRLWSIRMEDPSIMVQFFRLPQAGRPTGSLCLAMGRKYKTPGQ